MNARNVILASSVGFGIACGSPSPAAQSPSGAKSKEGTSEELSIGNAAVREGGFSVLGTSAGESSPPQTARVGTPLLIRAVLSDEKFKIDGLLREWPALRPAEGDKAIHTSFAILYDDTRLLLGVESAHPLGTRTAKFGPNEDKTVLVLAAPRDKEWTTQELGFFAGKSGESAGVVRFLSGDKKGQDVEGAKIIEAPKKGGGYTFEASVPWASLNIDTRLGMRGQVRIEEFSRGSANTAAVGSVTGKDPREWSMVLTEPEIALHEGLLEAKGLAEKAPAIDLFADINGDGVKERISVFDHFVTVCGPKYRGGKQFFYRDIGADVVSLEARPVAAKTRSDLVLQKRIAAPTSTRDILEIWSFFRDDPDTVFSHEVAIKQPGKSITNGARIRGNEIEVSLQPAVGWDADSYREPTLTDVDPALLPWGTVRSRLYRFDGKRFVQASEVSQAGAPRKEVAVREPPQPLPKDLPTPKVERGAGNAESLFEAFKKSRGHKSDAKPKTDLSVTVAEDSRPERIVLMGRDLAVMGPGFQSGTSYAFTTLDVEEQDIGEVSARDLTGDGNAEIVVRATKRVAHERDVVTSDVMMVFMVVDGAVKRVFAAESSRTLGKKHVQALVQFIPSRTTKAFDIDIQSGIAKGWTEKTYPWNSDSAGGSIEPVLVPWGKTKHLRYAWDGSHFAPH